LVKYPVHAMKEYAAVEVYCQPWYQAELSGQHHVPTALPPEGRDTLTHWGGGWVGSRPSLGVLEKRKNVLLVPGVEPGFNGCPACCTDDGIPVHTETFGSY
jgi:hypothetical protein